MSYSLITTLQAVAFVFNVKVPSKEQIDRKKTRAWEEQAALENFFRYLAELLHWPQITVEPVECFLDFVFSGYVVPGIVEETALVRRRRT